MKHFLFLFCSAVLLFTSSLIGAMACAPSSPRHLVTSLPCHPVTSPRSDEISDFVIRAANSRLTMDYSYIVDNGKVKLMGNGTLLVQDDKYYIEGDGLKIWCDGSSVWTCDEGAEEVVIEPASASNGLSANPILLVLNLDKLFTWDPSGIQTRFNGKTCVQYDLTPTENVGFDNVVLYMAETAPIGLEMVFSAIDFKFLIPSVDYSPYASVSTFTPPTFPSSYIVTDLR